MPLDGSNRAARQLRIRELLLQRPHFTIPELCTLLECSEATIRNDLRSMEKEGAVKRVYGGVMATNSTPPYDGMAARNLTCTEEKMAVARYAMEKYVHPGANIILDAGTTSNELAKLIAQLPFQVNVLTNSLSAAYSLSLSEHHVLHLAGGVYNSLSGAFRDQNAMNYLRSIHADIFFMCPTGISYEVGFVVPESTEAQVKQTMIERSEKVIALSDHSKVGKNSFCVVCGFDKVEMLILDDRCDEEKIGKLVAAGCRVELAPVAV